MRSLNTSIKRSLARVEPALQHDGFQLTFIFLYVLVNIICFFAGAAPSWRLSAKDPFHEQAAYAVARGGGALLNLNSALIIFVASRSLMTFLRGTILNMIVPFDKAMPAFHSLVGNGLTFATILHVLGHIVRYSSQREFTFGFYGTISLAITGSFLTVIMLSMKFTALKRVRRRTFETFYWVHSIGCVLFFVLLIVHGSHHGSLNTWMYIIAPLSIYILDRLYRLYREEGSRLSIARDSAVLKGSDTVCLRVPRTFTYLAGQYCDIKVPLVSQLEWHPFTIASSPHENEMLFFIKVNGDWTRKLYDLFKERQGNWEDMFIHVRGPYGAPAQHVNQYEHVVCISGGIGATPFSSIVKYAHYLILNHTRRGADFCSNSVSAAFTRNQSVRGTPSVPATPPHKSGFGSSQQRSRDASRRISRNQSTSNFPNMSRNFSRAISKSGSRNMSRSASGRLARFDSRASNPVSRSASGQFEKYTSGTRSPSTQTNDSVGLIVKEQRANQPHGPAFGSNVSSSQDSGDPMSPTLSPRVNSPNENLLIPSRDNIALAIPGAHGSSGDDDLKRFLESEEEDMYARPDDYDEELGNPDAPIPDRRVTPTPEAAVSPTKQHQTFEIVKEYDSNQALFDDDDEVQSTRAADGVGRGVVHDSFALDPMDLEAGEWDYEDDLMAEHQTPSNALNLLGMSFGPGAMMRYLYAAEQKKLRSSMAKASMNLMDDAVEAAFWQDRLLFYLHTVTVNWALLWVMLVRFAVVCIGAVCKHFELDQTGLGVFETTPFNAIDVILATVLAVPVTGAILLEIYMHGLSNFITDGLGNSFDLFVLVPLMTGSVLLHILNFAGVGKDIEHISVLLVVVVWPVLSLFLLWRIGRTIGSRVILAQYFKPSHARTKSLDFIWVSKTYQDDAWLIDELLPLTDSNIVRLHRFITRHGAKYEPWMMDYEKIPLKTTYARPDWEEVFTNLVERSKSGTVIGVFFCGPDGMARMVQQAAMNAMQKSIQNAVQRGFDMKRTARDDEGGFSRNRSDRGGAKRVNRAASGAPGAQEGHDGAAYGCGVRISVRIENFT
eukprot:gb/GEZJ01002825.1/.p1 GENE.gb/GEZJ01002825.1/~~gb/GEZJ01002825.1/.p1  ORF type:complete len:1060 (-),score=150.15 gb/GEZJ01002825.1/:639-3818(-)